MCIFHNYSKYGNIFRDYSARQFQFRKCKKCGKTDIRKICSLVSLDIQSINEELEKSIKD